MFTSLLPWAGLAAVAARVDLWAIIAALGGPAVAGRATAVDWVAAGLPLDLLHRLGEHPAECGGTPLVPDGPDWPQTLAGQPFAPVLLGAEGDLALLSRPGVAIVGARACTSYGHEQARALARAVVGAGGVVVSGLARGVDREAHLAAPGATIAVLGQGLSSPMPAWQAQLRRRVLAEGGLVLAEFPAHMAPDIWTFPVRNRVVAGLARATVVVEAGHRSGAKNTAAHALRLGREVLAVPGPLNAEASAGCLDLLEDGAIMVRNPATVLAAAGLTPKPAGRPPTGDARERVYLALGDGSSPEAVMRATSLPHAEVAAALVVLGLEGRITRLPGNRWVPRC